jgi:hypothetical protein
MYIENPEGASQIQSVPLSREAIAPAPFTAKEPSVAVTPSFVLLFIHSLKNEKATSEELMFCSLVDTRGASTALRLAKGFLWKFYHPIQLLHLL